VAKKVRRKPDEDDAERAFQFPEFDERKFLDHEYEQTRATIVAFLYTVLVALVSFGLDRVGLPLFLAPAAGLALIVASPWVIRQFRTGRSEFTKGDWAALILMELFGWLGIWFVLGNVLGL
jgi:hypothetical protein